MVPHQQDLDFARFCILSNVVHRLFGNLQPFIRQGMQRARPALGSLDIPAPRPRSGKWSTSPVRHWHTPKDPFGDTSSRGAWKDEALLAATPYAMRSARVPAGRSGAGPLHPRLIRRACDPRAVDPGDGNPLYCRAFVRAGTRRGPDRMGRASLRRRRDMAVRCRCLFEECRHRRPANDHPPGEPGRKRRLTQMTDVTLALVGVSPPDAAWETASRSKRMR
ncbi:hypothetical protein ABIC65_002636 [Sphingomonas trueperi]